MERFKIREDYGHWFVRDLDGHYLNAGELHALIQSLLETHKLLVDSPMSTQEAVLKASIEARVEKLLEGAEVHYSHQHIYMGYRPDRHRIGQSTRFAGVYVLTSPARRDQVKIGVSSDVYLRTKQLYYDYGRVPMEVIAVIESLAPAALETALHRKFASCHIDGEWFARQPVEAWLHEVDQ